MTFSMNNNNRYHSNVLNTIIPHTIAIYLKYFTVTFYFCHGRSLEGIIYGFPRYVLVFHSKNSVFHPNKIGPYFPLRGLWQPIWRSPFRAIGQLNFSIEVNILWVRTCKLLGILVQYYTNSYPNMTHIINTSH